MTPARRPRTSERGRRPARRPIPSGTRSLGGEQVEGRQAVRELLAAGRRRATVVWMVEGAHPSPILAEIADLAAAKGVPVRRVSRARFEAEARTDGAQGVLAHAAPLPEADLDDLYADVAGAAPFLLGFDGVTDPQNLGAMLRTAEAAGATGAVLARHRAVHITPAATKAAAGAVERLPMAVAPGMAAAVARAAESGVWTVGLDADGDRSLFELPLAEQPLMLVVGDEGRGLSRLVKQRCDVVARIPLRGAISSLSVAAAGALALFEVSRRR